MATSGVTRRGLLAGTATGVALSPVLASPPAWADDTSAPTSAPSGQIDIELQVSGARLPCR